MIIFISSEIESGKIAYKKKFSYKIKHGTPHHLHNDLVGDSSDFQTNEDHFNHFGNEFDDPHNIHNKIEWEIRLGDKIKGKFFKKAQPRLKVYYFINFFILKSWLHFKCS